MRTHKWVHNYTSDLNCCPTCKWCPSPIYGRDYGFFMMPTMFSTIIVYYHHRCSMKCSQSIPTDRQKEPEYSYKTNSNHKYLMFPCAIKSMIKAIEAGSAGRKPVNWRIFSNRERVSRLPVSLPDRALKFKFIFLSSIPRYLSNRKENIIKCKFSKAILL